MSKIEKVNYKVDLILKYLVVKELKNYYSDEYMYILSEEKAGRVKKEDVRQAKENSMESAYQLSMILNKMREEVYEK